MADSAKIQDLRRQEKALASAERLINRIVTQVMSLNGYTLMMDELFDANRDLSEIQEARRDPWRDGTKVFDALDIVRQELRRHGAQI